jgi:predicted nucleotide-binding protein
MNVEEVRQRLEGGGLNVTKSERLPNGVGDRLECKGGEVVCIYDSGKFVVQGKNVDTVKRLLEIPVEAAAAVARTEEAVAKTNRNVFVVYGHDGTARTQLEAMLRRWQLEPIILDQIPSEGQTLIEKLEKYSHQDVCFAVVLATPDDFGYRKDHEDEKKFRARQNVILELGLLLGKLGRAKVGIFIKNQEEMERPSDIQGLIYLPFVNDVEEAKLTLAKEMEKQGIKVEVSKL